VLGLTNILTSTIQPHCLNSILIRKSLFLSPDVSRMIRSSKSTSNVYTVHPSDLTLCLRPRQQAERTVAKRSRYETIMKIATVTIAISTTAQRSMTVTFALSSVHSSSASTRSPATCTVLMIDNIGRYITPHNAKEKFLAASRGSTL